MLQSHPQQHQQRQQRQSPVKLTDKCFNCGKPGHWSIACPDKPNNHEFPATHCPCGVGHCDIKISNSINNPNRKYYDCPGKKGMHCGYFDWCDVLVKQGNVRVIQPKPYPVCECRAGVCIIEVEQNGLNAGRSYFACRIEKGHGACNFKQWLDNSPESLSITSSNPVAWPSATLDDFDFNKEVEMQLDAIEMLARTPSKDVIHVESDDGEIQGAAYGLPMETLAVHPRPFVNNIPGNPDSDMISQNGDTLNHQMHISQVDDAQTSHTKVVAALNEEVVEGALQMNAFYPGAQPRFGTLPNPHSLTSTTLEAVGNFALQLQNDLIKKLESTNPHSHKIMTKEANSTFSALERLQVDFKPLHSKVMEYIKQASTLAHIEQLINNETSPEDLITHRDNEQRRYDELVKAQQEALDAYNASNSQFSLLCAKASGFNCPSELSNRLLTCKAETAYRQETLLKITQTISECRESLEAASQKADEALEESETRGVEWSEAQAAFQKARAQLRN